MRLFNSLTRQVEEFRPLQAGRAGLYTCGPTVYDFAHIGNFRTYVFEDLLKRVLLSRGYQVKHVMNVTDVDDKTIKQALGRGVSLGELTDQYTEAFLQDAKLLNILPADFYPRATEHIPEMVSLIESLLAKGHAYRKDGSIYFSIDSFPTYGRLSRVNAADLQTSERLDNDEYEKEEARDFALWKARKGDEVFWSTPLGDGRPGWHIECSAMSMKYLGPHFDLHIGGVDNMFPHHENEIAQSSAATGEAFVNYWLHCQHLVVEGRKMAKSAGNFYTLRDLVAAGHEPMALRYLLISAHYRKVLNFTFSGLEMARQSLNRIREFLSGLPQNVETGESSPEISALVQDADREFSEFLADDLNISGALAAAFDLIRGVNLFPGKLSGADVELIKSFWGRFQQVTGVLPEIAGESEELAAHLQEKISRRQQARAAGDFKTADVLRAELLAEGIVLQDTPQGVRWKKNR